MAIPRRAHGRWRAREARRHRRELAGLEVCRVGAARRAAPAGNRPQGHREGAGLFGPPRHAREGGDSVRRISATRVPALLEEIQKNLLARARAVPRRAHLRGATWDEFTAAMEGRPGFVIAAWCGSAECEAAIKAETQATLRNIPLGSPRVDGQCVKCNGSLRVQAWFAKAY